MKKLTDWKHMDAKVDPGGTEPVLLIFYTDKETIGIPLTGKDVWHMIKLMIRSWWAHLKLKWFA